jgi:hypothetical protein
VDMPRWTVEWVEAEVRSWDPVTVGPLTLPSRRFSADALVVDVDGRRFRVRLGLEVADERVEVRSVRVEAEAGAAIAYRDLRLPLAALVEWATVSAVRMGGTVGDDGALEVFQALASRDPSDLADVVRAVERLIRKDGRELTDGFLELVVEVYRGAVRDGEHPAQAVMAAFGLAPTQRSTAFSWFKVAEQRGLLLREDRPRKRSRGQED